MKKNYKQILPFIIIIVIILIIGSYFIYQNIKEDNKKESSKTTSDIDTKINTDDGDEDIDWSNYSEEDISTAMTITESGTYNLEGTIN